MADIDPNLVKVIAEAVMAALRAAGQNGTPTSIHPPIGQCTGDYSKFPDLRNIATAPPPATPALAPIAAPAPASAPTPVRQYPLLKGVITVSALKAAKGPVRIAKGAILSPLAQDYIKDKNVYVLSDESSLPASVSGATIDPTKSTGGTFWWIGGSCPSVIKTSESVRTTTQIVPSRQASDASLLVPVLKEFIGLLKTKQVVRGILFVQSAARAVCIANRCPSLRAIVATSDRAVAEGIDLVGANLLLVEYPPLGHSAMLTLVNPFLRALPAAPSAVQRELSELLTCG